jgi:SmpA / OmlA family
VKLFIIVILLGFLSACVGLESKSLQLEVGSSKEDILKIMGTPAYQATQDGVIAWRYAARVGFGYCDYREFYILRDKVIHINQYYHSSLAGCTVGLQKIDWGPVLAKADELKREHPQESKQTTQP